MERKIKDLEKRLNEAKILRKVSSELAHTTELSKMYEIAVKGLIDNFDFDSVGLYLYDSLKDELVLKLRSTKQGMVHTKEDDPKLAFSPDFHVKDLDQVTYTSKFTKNPKTEIAIPLYAHDQFVGAIIIDNRDKEKKKPRVAQISNGRFFEEFLEPYGHFVAGELYAGQEHEILTDVTSVVLHEVRSGLVTTGGFSEYLLKELTKKDMSREELVNNLRRIKNGSIRAESACDSFDKYRRLISGSPLDKSTIPLVSKVIKPTIRRIDPIHYNFSGKLKTDFESVDEVVVNVDPEYFSWLYRNAFLNAQKHGKSADGSEDYDIGFSAQKKNGTVECSVWNHASPLSKEELSRMFNKDERLKKTKQGWGLGMWIMKRIIDVHDGEIWAEYDSKESKFYVKFKLPEK